MNYCCKKMSEFACQTKGNFNSDNIIYYSSQFDEYGIVIHDGGNSFIIFNYCPWCGKKLPASKRDLWFEEIEALGIEFPLISKVPNEFETDEWWKKRNL